jgi:hypothetical protein
MDNYCCDIQYTVQYMYLQLYFQYGDCQSPAGTGGGFLPLCRLGFSVHFTSAGDLHFQAWKTACSPECNSFPFW